MVLLFEKKTNQSVCDQTEIHGLMSSCPVIQRFKAIGSLFPVLAVDASTARGPYSAMDVYEAALGAMGQYIDLEDLSVAREIQEAMNFTNFADLLHLVVMHKDGTCTILHATFDHTKFNGFQALQILRQQSKEIMDLFFASESACPTWEAPNHKHLVVQRKAPQIPKVFGLNPMQEILSAHIFQGPCPRLKVREIYREIFRLFASDFFMCIDISHLFAGEPCMLRIFYQWNRDFDEQWDEMIALKKSKDMVLCSWRLHLQKQAKWASHLPQVSPDWIPLYGNGTNNPLGSTDMMNITAVAFSLFGDKSGCFFSLYPCDEPRGSKEFQSRFQTFKKIFHLEPSLLRLRQARLNVDCLSSKLPARL